MIMENKPFEDALSLNRSRSLWDAAMRRFETAVAASKEFDAAQFEPAYEREKTFLAQHGADSPKAWERAKLLRKQHPEHFVSDELNDRYEKLDSEILAAEEELMLMPAPDGRALAWKLDTIMEVGSKSDSTPTWDRAYIGQMIVDYHHLLGGAHLATVDVFDEPTDLALNLIALLNVIGDQVADITKATGEKEAFANAWINEAASNIERLVLIALRECHASKGAR